MKRPLSVTIISWVFITAGTVGFFYHLRELTPQTPFENDAVWILGIRLLATVGGVGALKGKNTARWLLVAWVAYHVVLSYFHDLAELITHAVLLIAVIALLFNRRATGFFKHHPGGAAPRQH